MHEMNTCAVRGSIEPGAICGKVIVGGKFCGHDGDCPHKLVEMCEATDEILPVFRVTKDCGDYMVKCPHCLRLIGLEGDDMSQLRGEQFQHRHCGGWLGVAINARFVPVL